MIRFLSNWIEGIAIAVIVGNIFEMIIPNGNIKKYVKMILGLYVIFSIISPFVNSKELYSFDINETLETYSSDISKQTSSNGTDTQNLNNIYVKTLQDEITKIVEKQGFCVNSCEVIGIFEGESDKLGINQINIVLDSKNSNYENVENDNSNISIETVNEVVINVNGSSENSNKPISDKDVKNLKKYLSEHYELDKKVINITY